MMKNALLPMSLTKKKCQIALCNLNYYLSYDVCARFRLCLCLCLSAKKKLSNGCRYQKMLVNKVVTFLKRIKMAVLFFDFFGSDPSKMDQT